MSDTSIEYAISNLGSALSRLEEALEHREEDPLVVDSTIQRFEFVVELCWKTFMRGLAAEGVQSTTPRDAIKQAGRVGWLIDEALWLAMLADRNATSHVYNEAQARAIYKRIKQYLPAMKSAYAAVRKRFTP